MTVLYSLLCCPGTATAFYSFRKQFCFGPLFKDTFLLLRLYRVNFFNALNIDNSIDILCRQFRVYRNLNRAAAGEMLVQLEKEEKVEL